MEEVVRKLNLKLRKENPTHEIRYYNNKYSKGPLFQFCRSYPPGNIKYVYFQTTKESEAVKEFKRIITK